MSSSVITQSLSEYDCHWKKTRLRVPSTDGTLYAVPCFKKSQQEAKENRELFASTELALLGEPLARFRFWARSEVIEAAHRYTAELVDSPLCSCQKSEIDFSKPLFISGHQPALFHPGVWVKNFGVNKLAQQAGGTALNLIVDNDIISTTSLRVPTGDRCTPTVTSIPFDDISPSQPWEEATVNNRDLFLSFSNRISKAMAHWGIDPLIEKQWQQAVNKLETTSSLRDSLSAVRVQQEREWGVNNLELPISHLCQLDSFLHFVLHLLLHLDEFQAVHNQTLAEYRDVYHVRSKTHPVPELVNYADGWLEAPFWIWKKGDQQRQHLRVKRDGDRLLLSDGNQIITTLPIANEEDNTAPAMAALRQLSQQGWKLRTRALTTTLFARLCVADLFVHGIGGAKYDELTDQIICRFFKMPAPGFSTMSATLFLPVAKPFDVSVKDEYHLKNKLRDLHYNPSRYYEAGENAAIDKLIEEQQQLIQQQNNRTTKGESRKVRRAKSAGNRSRYLRFKQLRKELSSCATEQITHLETELSKIQCQLAANRVLKNREFSLALYPSEKLSSFLMHIDAQKPVSETNSK
ncbi:hypothetical protein MNBD_PLANCTO02-3181 [hydrothermal vent metagenome]|uniref:Uncharacterized protein n=1 Tax=hydrothermal vent metagenome TaxID=652676 RepID=A0A3B1E1H9_9ZZZZ